MELAEHVKQTTSPGCASRNDRGSVSSHVSRTTLSSRICTRPLTTGTSNVRLSLKSFLSRRPGRMPLRYHRRPNRSAPNRTQCQLNGPYRHRRNVLHIVPCRQPVREMMDAAIGSHVFVPVGAAQNDASHASKRKLHVQFVDSAHRQWVRLAHRLRSVLRTRSRDTDESCLLRDRQCVCMHRSSLCAQQSRLVERTA
jgi:hypothetical protein